MLSSSVVCRYCCALHTINIIYIYTQRIGHGFTRHWRFNEFLKMYESFAYINNAKRFRQWDEGRSVTGQIPLKYHYHYYDYTQWRGPRNNAVFIASADNIILYYIIPTLFSRDNMSNITIIISYNVRFLNFRHVSLCQYYYNT